MYWKRTENVGKSKHIRILSELTKQNVTLKLHLIMTFPRISLTIEYDKERTELIL